MHQKPDEVFNRAGGEAGVPGASLSDEIVSFIESGLSIVVGVMGPGGRATTGRALAVRVLPDGLVRLIYAEEGNAALSATAAAGRAIAVTFSAPLSHRTLQIKGFSSSVAELEPDDSASVQRQTDAFGAILGAIGYPPSFVQAFSDYRSSPLCVLSFRAEAAFEQTPGPGAGRSI